MFVVGLYSKTELVGKSFDAVPVTAYPFPSSEKEIGWCLPLGNPSRCSHVWAIRVEVQNRLAISNILFIVFFLFAWLTSNFF